MVKNQACVGIFVIFTAKRLHWVMKRAGESRTGQYFRDIVLTENVFPFLKSRENVVDLDEVIFVHDKVPCMRANQTNIYFKTMTSHFGVMIFGQEIHLTLLKCSYLSRLRAVKNAKNRHTDYWLYSSNRQQVKRTLDYIQFKLYFICNFSHTDDRWIF